MVIRLPRISNATDVDALAAEPGVAVHLTADPDVVTAADLVIVEVEEIVETGDIPPDQVHLPGIYVHRLVLNATPEKRIEKRTVTPTAGV